MSYKSLKDIPFPWEFKDLMKLPLFMIEEIYRVLDEQIEEEKKRINSLKNKQQLNQGF